MRIENRVEVPASVEDIWNVLGDVPRVAACMPGANLTEVVDDRTYRGTVAVQVGPISMQYRGTVVIERRDPDEYEMLLNAAGSDRKGAGSAKANVVAKLVPMVAGGTELAVVTDLKLSGRVASLGRGVQDVATQLFKQFAEQLNAEITATAPTRSSAEPVGDAPPPPGSTATTDGTRTANGSSISLGRILWSLLKDKVSAVFGRSRRAR